MTDLIWQPPRWLRRIAAAVVLLVLVALIITLWADRSVASNLLISGLTLMAVALFVVGDVKQRWTYAAGAVGVALIAAILSSPALA